MAHFLEQIAKESGQRKIYAPEAVELLATAEWPGNVRQLYNVVRQNVALSHGAIITAELVQQSLGGNPTRLPSFDEARDEFTRNYLSQILQITARQREPGGAPRQAQPHRFLQAAVAPPAAAGRFQEA